jgi:hypothetical protein
MLENINNAIWHYYFVVEIFFLDICSYSLMFMKQIHFITFLLSKYLHAEDKLEDYHLKGMEVYLSVNQLWCIYIFGSVLWSINSACYKHFLYFTVNFDLLQCKRRMQKWSGRLPCFPLSFYLLCQLTHYLSIQPFTFIYYVLTAF